MDGVTTISVQGKADTVEPEDRSRPVFEKDHILRFTEHQVVFHEGDDVGGFYQVVEGSIMLYKLLPDGRRQVVELVGPGNVFGMTCDDMRDCSAETLTPARLKLMYRGDCETVPDSHCRLCRQMQERIRDIRSHTVLLGRKSAMERVASFVLYLVYERHVGAEDRCDLGHQQKLVMMPLTRQEIADYLGLTLETVSRSFSELKRRELIDFDRHDQVHVRDLSGLYALSGSK